MAACAEAQGQPLLLAPHQTLHFAIVADVASLDPALALPGTSADIVQNLFDGLLQVSDADGTVVPSLAQSLPRVSPDGRNYTFTLDPRARFSNGHPVTSDDVLFSWRRAAAMPGLGPLLFAPVDLPALAAPDSRTVVLHLKESAGYMPRRLAQTAAAIVDHTDPLVGTGLFKLASRRPGATLTFVPVMDWWGSPKPSLSSVTIDVQPDVATAFDMYVSGAYDAVGFAGMPVAGVTSRLRADRDDLHSLGGPGATWLGFSFKPGSPVAGDGGRGVRRALAYGVDRVALSKGLCNGGARCAQPQGGLVPAGMAGYLGLGLDPLTTFDSSAGRILLATSDPSGAAAAKLTLGYADNPGAGALAAALVRQWQANLGLELKAPVAVPPAQWVQRRDSGEFALFLRDYTPAYDDPQQWYRPVFGPDAAGSVGFSEPAFDSLAGTADAAALIDSGAAYAAAAAQLSADVAYAPLVTQSRRVSFRTYLRGAGASADRDWRWSLIQVLQH